MTTGGKQAASHFSASESTAKRWFAAFCLVLALFAGWQATSDYRRSLEVAEVRSNATGMLLVQWLGDYFRASDQLLQGLVAGIDPDELVLPDADGEASQRLTRKLRETLAVVGYVDEIALFSARGLLTHTTAHGEIGLDASRYDFFATLRDQSVSSFVSRAFRAPERDAFRLAQARPVRDSAGRFRGVAVFYFDLGSFRGWLDRVNMAVDASVAIVDTDLSLLASRPKPGATWFAMTDEGKVESLLLQQFIESGLKRSSFNNASAIDGEQRVLSAARVPGLPIVILVAESRAKALAQWWRHLLGLGVGLAFICGLGYFGLRAYLQMRSHGLVLRESRAALEQTNAALAAEIGERKTSEARFRSLFENSLNGVALHEVILDDAGEVCDYRFVMANHAFEVHSGLNAKDVIGRCVTEVQPSIRGSGLIEIYGKVALSGEPARFEAFITQLGRHFDISAFQVGFGRFAAVFEDVTARKNAELELQIAATAFEAQEGMLITDANAVILRVNRAFTQMTGFSAEEAVGKTPRMLRSGRHDADFYAAMWASIAADGVWQGELWNRRKNGETYPQWLTITAVRSSTGEISHYVGTLTDISERKAAEDEVRDLAFYDPLTHLPNRRLLIDRLRRAISGSSRSAHWSALLFMDLDDFKLLNDSLGHDKGDLLLQRVATRLQGCLRESDTIARLGGDEFVIIFENICELGDDPAPRVEALGRKLLDALAETHDLDGYTHRASASIGVTFFGGVPVALEELMKQADLAMYQAKAAGRNALRFFDPAMQAAVNERAVLQAEMRAGLERGEFVVHYQPQIDASNRVVGMEALVRWQHPQRGLVAPGTFIEVAEQTGLIVPLGQFVLRAACNQLARWARSAGSGHLTVSVNISARQFHEEHFVASVHDAISAARILPTSLRLEITESMLLDDIDTIIATMTELKQIGVGFSLDDFGTGYSSLAYLKRLPLDEIKIDQSFVRDVITNPNDAAIAKTIIALANSLELEVVAEGVETRAQLDWLIEHGCGVFQGYFFGRPAAIVVPHDMVSDRA